MFITGADANTSNLATKTTDANAIFLDGTSKVIEVSKTKGNGFDNTTISPVNKVVKMYDSANDLKTVMTVPGLTVKNGSNLEINVMVTFKGTGTDTNTYTVSGTCYIA